MYLKSGRFKWPSLPVCCATVFAHFPCQTLKESINEFIVNPDNQGITNIWSHIYNPTPPPPTTIITEIKIITFLVTLTSVIETDAMILTVITTHKMLKVLLPQQQKLTETETETYITITTITTTET